MDPESWTELRTVMTAKNPVFEIQERQEEIVEINPEYNDSKMIIKVVSPSSFQSRIYKWPEASTTKPKAVDTYCLDYKPSKGRRWAAKAPSTRITYGTITKKRGYCAEDQTIESWKEEGFPTGLKLAVLGIFIIVVFVYITVENKSLFG
ncbi:LEM domain-containing protein 1 isoform X8 [Macaca fascicularis]|uniref:LEM domain-containing protein 1 isoform X8 n=1 Tax=Macaca fascicularis TaxID=9541 RepID=UPI003D15442E